jgi:hypothetical protein
MGIPDVYVDLSQQVSIWAGSATAIQWWRMVGDAGQVFQLIILVVLVYLAISIVYRFIQKFTRRDAEE